MAGVPFKRRTAVVVIHGVGDQAPLSTLGRFAQGIMDHCECSGGPPEAVLARSRTGVRPLLRFGSVAGRELDVFEFAWQEHVRGRIRLPEVLAWLLGTLLAPLDFRKHWRVLSEAGEDTPPAWLVVMRQLLIALGLLAGMLSPLVMGALLLMWLPASPLTGGGLLISLGDALMLVLSLLLGVLALALLAGVGRDALEAWAIARRTRRLHGEREWAGLYAGSARKWRTPALLAGALSVALAGAAAWIARDIWQVAAVPLADPEFRLLAALLLGLVLVAHLASTLARLLVRYMGDITLYVKADSRPEFARSRDDIKAACGRLVGGLLRDPAYDSVLLVGHSLGSVIALDALNLLSREARVEAGSLGPPLHKLRGMLTFGSPLDKVGYFFREGVSDSAAIHAQLLSFLHPTKRRPSRRDDGPYRLGPYQVPFGWLKWTNLHAPSDIISDPLVFHEVNRRVKRNYAPFGAHSRYWRDPVLYREFQRLLR